MFIWKIVLGSANFSKGYGIKKSKGITLSELNKIGSICDNLTIKEYDFYHADGTTKRYLDITCPYSSSIANNPLKTTSLLIG